MMFYTDIRGNLGEDKKYIIYYFVRWSPDIIIGWL